LKYFTYLCVESKHLLMAGPAAAAAIAAGAQVAGGGLNAVSTAFTNRKQRKWSEQMYNRQRDDNIAFWNMHNEYNSPAMQMKRLREAGLNPNLVYGGSSGGTAGTASPIKTPDVQQVTHRAPEWGNAVSGAGLTTLNALYDFEIKQAQIDNMKADNTIKMKDALLREAQFYSTLTDVERKKFDLKYDTELYKTNADIRREMHRQLKVQTDNAIREDFRRTLTTSSSLQEAIARIGSIKASEAKTKAERQRIIADTNRIKSDTMLKQLDIELRKNGINPSDPMYIRILGRYLEGLFSETDVESIGRSHRKKFDYFKGLLNF
jgi:hypothetical protein